MTIRDRGGEGHAASFERRTIVCTLRLRDVEAFQVALGWMNRVYPEK